MKRPDYKIALRFLQKIRARGPWTISAIFPNGGERVPTRTFIFGTADDPNRVEQNILDWLKELNEKRMAGVYFTANPPRTRMRKRPKETDIGFCQYIGADFDPLPGETAEQCQKRVRALLDKAPIPPTFVWSSGRGIQAMWRLRPVIKLRNARNRIRVKGAAAGLRHALGGKRVGLDSTASVEHLFRLPGTYNYPNANKIAAGFKTSIAGDFEHYPERVYTLDEFPSPPANHTAPKVRGVEVAQEPPGGWDTRAGLYDGKQYLQHTADTAREGVSGSAIRTARKLRDFGVAEDTAFDLMLECWVPRCEYEWNEEELRGKIKRAYTGAANDAGCLTIEYAMQDANEEDEEHDFG